MVLAGVTIAGPVSGGHLNLAVSFGLFLSGRVSLLRAILYITVQCAGGIGKNGSISIMAF